MPSLRMSVYCEESSYCCPISIERYPVLSVQVKLQVPVWLGASAVYVV